MIFLEVKNINYMKYFCCDYIFIIFIYIFIKKKIFFVLFFFKDEKIWARDLILFLGILYWVFSLNFFIIIVSGNMEKIYFSSLFIFCFIEFWVSWVIFVFNFIFSMYLFLNLFFKCWVGLRYLLKFMGLY